jgi:hypothetical protein
MVMMKKTYMVSLSTKQICFIYDLLVKEHHALYEQDRNNSDVETAEFCLWALESAEGTYVSTFEDLLEERGQEDGVE